MVGMEHEERELPCQRSAIGSCSLIGFPAIFAYYLEDHLNCSPWKILNLLYPNGLHPTLQKSLAYSQAFALACSSLLAFLAGLHPTTHPHLQMSLT